MRKRLLAWLAALAAMGGHVAVAEPTRDALALELADQRATVDRALATVAEKLTALDTERTARLAAAYRALRHPAAAHNDTMLRARRTAALRLLAKRDAAERTLLADEATHLTDAQRRITGEVEALRT
ncbi:MAG: hypothetical protein NT062_08105, partial [Proteobacteria bacterium]|nr:hypothetical protein [Pseudomonadota bacterium]